MSMNSWRFPKHSWRNQRTIGYSQTKLQIGKKGEAAIDACGVGDVETLREKRIRERRWINKERKVKRDEKIIIDYWVFVGQHCVYGPSTK